MGFHDAFRIRNGPGSIAGQADVGFEAPCRNRRFFETAHSGANMVGIAVFFRLRPVDYRSAARNAKSLIFDIIEL
jgi:hypothetical protein